MKEGMQSQRKLGTPNSLCGLSCQVFQVAHRMRLTIESKEVDKCLHWKGSESC